MHRLGDYRGHIYPGYQNTRPGAVNTPVGGRRRRSAGRKVGSDATGRRQAIATGRPAPARLLMRAHLRGLHRQTCTAAADGRPDQRQAIATSRPQAIGSHTHAHEASNSTEQAICTADQRQAITRTHAPTHARAAATPPHRHSQPAKATSQTHTREATRAPALIPPPLAPPPNGGGSSWRRAAPLRVRERKNWLGMIQFFHFRWGRAEKWRGVQKIGAGPKGWDAERRGLSWERVIFVFLYGTARVREGATGINVGHKRGR